MLGHSRSIINTSRDHQTLTFHLLHCAYRRRTSLENIKKARAVHNRRVNQRRRESFDESSGPSPSRMKGMDEIESKLARAERNRDNLRRERRRRAMERYEEGKARALVQGAVVSATTGAGVRLVGAARASFGSGRDNRRKRVVEARQAAKARQTQRMRDLRQRMLSRDSWVSEQKTRLFAARLLQQWWRCIRSGKAFDVAELTLSSPDGTPLQRSPLGSPTAWASAHGLGLSLAEGFGPSPQTDDGTGKAEAQGAGSVLDPSTRSPLPTFRFSAGVSSTTAGIEKGAGASERSGGSDSASPRGVDGGASKLAMGYGFGSNHKAALAIQGFLRRNMHSLKVANALLAGRLSIKVLCAAVRTMSMSTFDEAIDVMSTRAIVSHCETALKALRMGREMRSVPQTVRSARAFLSALLVNFFPTSALDDEGALSSSPEGTAPLQLEKDRLVRAAGNAIQALLDLEATMDAAAVVATGGEKKGSNVNASTALGAEQFRKIRRASSKMVRARVAFCRRFAEWKRKDAVRLADEMTAASIDVLLMQLRAERDLHVAAVRYGINETDDGGALFSTGYEQIKEGTQRQLGKMMHALGKLVGASEARQRMDEATDAAFERLRADELAEDEAFMLEHAEFTDERMDTDDSDHGPQHFASSETKAAEGEISASEATATLLGKSGAPEEDDDIAGPHRPLSASDLLSNEWLVHEVSDLIFVAFHEGVLVLFFVFICGMGVECANI